MASRGGYDLGSASTGSLSNIFKTPLSPTNRESASAKRMSVPSSGWLEALRGNRELTKEEAEDLERLEAVQGRKKGERLSLRVHNVAQMFEAAVAAVDEANKQPSSPRGTPTTPTKRLRRTHSKIQSTIEHWTQMIEEERENAKPPYRRWRMFQMRNQAAKVHQEVITLPEELHILKLETTSIETDLPMNYNALSWIMNISLQQESSIQADLLFRLLDDGVLLCNVAAALFDPPLDLEIHSTDHMNAKHTLTIEQKGIGFVMR